MALHGHNVFYDHIERQKEVAWETGQRRESHVKINISWFLTVPVSAQD